MRSVSNGVWCVARPHDLSFNSPIPQAPGEAEAELAYLNRVGIIDAVYTDDVDTFLFGAKMIVRK